MMVMKSRLKQYYYENKHNGDDKCDVLSNNDKLKHKKKFNIKNNNSKVGVLHEVIMK